LAVTSIRLAVLMEVIPSSETSFLTGVIQGPIPEDGISHDVRDLIISK
jgi:hypothetical protein